MTIEIKIIWKTTPDEKQKKTRPEVLSKLEYYDLKKDVIFAPINDEKELFNSEYRSFIMAQLPRWFDFKTMRLFVLKTSQNTIR